MGAETETDGRGDAMKRKRYKLYDNYTTYYILVGIALMYALLAALNIWIYRECDVVSEKIALMLVLDIPGCIFLVLAYKPQVLSRFLTRCSFDAEGSIAGVRAGGALRFGGMRFVHMDSEEIRFRISQYRFYTSR